MSDEAEKLARAVVVAASKVILGPEMWPYSVPEMERAIPKVLVILDPALREAHEEGRKATLTEAMTWHDEQASIAGAANTVERDTRLRLINARDMLTHNLSSDHFRALLNPVPVPERPTHVCGASGFGQPEDRCPGCEAWWGVPERKEER